MTDPGRPRQSFSPLHEDCAKSGASGRAVACRPGGVRLPAGWTSTRSSRGRGSCRREDDAASNPDRARCLWIASQSAGLVRARCEYSEECRGMPREPMKLLTHDELIPQEEYERQRESYRQTIIALKQRRRITIGDKVTLVFENRETLRFQIQEMIRVERIVDPQKGPRGVGCLQCASPGLRRTERHAPDRAHGSRHNEALARFIHGAWITGTRSVFVQGARSSMASSKGGTATRRRSAPCISCDSVRHPRWCRLSVISLRAWPFRCAMVATRPKWRCPGRCGRNGSPI